MSRRIESASGLGETQDPFRLPLSSSDLARQLPEQSWPNSLKSSSNYETARTLFCRTSLSPEEGDGESKALGKTGQALEGLGIRQRVEELFIFYLTLFGDETDRLNSKGKIRPNNQSIEQIISAVCSSYGTKQNSDLIIADGATINTPRNGVLQDNASPNQPIPEIYYRDPGTFIAECLKQLDESGVLLAKERAIITKCFCSLVGSLVNEKFKISKKPESQVAHLGTVPGRRSHTNGGQRQNGTGFRRNPSL